ncbi:hypothetical protein [Candidatus Phytoplasma ziziphi]|nr:hypothetical protein [Candidatus Phytoplasma ziziphi]
MDENFCYSKLGACNGAFGKINNDIRGGVYSRDFVCFKLNPNYSWLV